MLDSRRCRLEHHLFFVADHARIEVGHTVGREQITVQRILLHLVGISDEVFVGRGRILDVDAVFAGNKLLVTREGTLVQARRVVAVAERRALPLCIQFFERQFARMQERVDNPEAFPVFCHGGSFFLIVQR